MGRMQQARRHAKVALEKWGTRAGYAAMKRVVSILGPETRVESGARLGPVEYARRLKAYAETQDDAGAAAMLGIKRATFCAWRRSLGLPPKRGRGHKLTPSERERRISAINSAKTDAEAARMLGMSTNALSSWRRQALGTEKRGKPRQPRLPAEEEERRMRAWTRSNADPTAVAALGIDFETYRQWRRSRGLPPKPPLNKKRA